MSRGLIYLLAALAWLGALTGAGVLTQPSAPPPAAQGARLMPVLGQTFVCPDLTQDGDKVVTTISVGSTAPGAGLVTIAPLGRAQDQPRVLLKRGLEVHRYGARGGPTLLRATGQIAGGVVAEEITRGRLTASRGYSETPCTAPRTEQWFVGASTTVGADPFVQLVNTDDVAALVDVNVLTPAGQADAPLGQGLVVAPRSVQRIRLDTIAPDAAVTAVSVVARTGRVAAAVHDVRTHGEENKGIDWVPMVPAPARVLDVAGIPAGTADRTLVIGNPGEHDVLAGVQLVTPEGRFVPTGMEAVAIRAGGVVRLDVGKTLGDAPGLAEVTSQSDPLVAAVVVDEAATFGPVHEISFLGAAQPLSGASLVPDVRADTDIESRLILSAPGSEASVAISVPATDGHPKRVFRVRVPAGHTLAVAMSDYLKGASYATITPDAGTGRVFAVRALRELGSRGPLLSSYAVTGSSFAVEVPGARRDIGVWAGR